MTITVYSTVKITAGQNSWFFEIATKFLGNVKSPCPVSNPQLLRDILAARTNGMRKSTATKMSVGIV